MSVTVEVPQPAPWLAINNRDHWARTAAKVKAWRTAACEASKDAPALIGTVTITATIHKATRARYDLDGTAPTVKACIDGLRDAGLIIADEHDAVVRVVIEPGEVRKPGSVELTVTRVPVRPTYVTGGGAV